MNIFAITTNIEFIRKPDWLDSFFFKHNKRKYNFHITLKQPCIIQENQVMTIKNVLSEYILTKNPKQIKIDFSKLKADDSESVSGGGCIMIEAENNQIKVLQKEIVDALSDYRNHLAPQTKFYEENFIPHITIADNLNKEEFVLAKKDVKDDFFCQGNITQIYLYIVRNFDSNKKTSSDTEIVTYKL